MNATPSTNMATRPAMYPPVRLSVRHRRVLYASFVVLWLSGALWLLFHYFLQRAGAFGNEPHALEPWWLRLHGLAMMIALIGAGSVLVHHAQRAWRLGKNRFFGGLLTGVLLWLAVSGYALYYFAGDDNRAWLPLLHWLPGLLLPLVVVSHVRRGQRRHHRGAVDNSRESSVRRLPARPRALPYGSSK
jgi:hypothetical protein